MARNNRSVGRPSNGAARSNRRRGRGTIESMSRGSSSSRSRRGATRASALGKSIGGGIRGAGSRAVDSVTAHPIPALMIGAGLAWLLLESRTLRPMERRLLERGRRAFGSVGETAGEYAREGAHAVYEGANAMTRRAQRSLKTTRQTLGETWESHPLAVGAAVLAAGVAAAILLPATMSEVRWMGETSGALTRTVRRKGKQLLKQGKQFASEAANIATREARRQGLTTRELVGKVKRVADKAREMVAPTE
jgi:hypothetical protein